VAGPFEHGNKLWHSTKCVEFFGLTLKAGEEICSIELIADAEMSLPVALNTVTIVSIPVR